MAALSRRWRNALPAVSVVLTLGLTVAGCSSSASEPKGPQTRASGVAGGTLEVLAGAGAVAHLDPQRMTTPAEADLGRLLYRGLTAYPTTTAPAHALPDLAAGPGKPSDHAKTWTFTLRPDVKFEDGTAITSADVRRAVERSFDKSLGGPPAYLRDLIDCGHGYAGPASGSCMAIETPDPTTVVFHLRVSTGDFPDVVARPAFLPVPDSSDLDRHPVSSGPYRVASYTPGQQLTLERNPQWQQASDLLRPALPDHVDVSLGVSPADAVRRLRENTGDDARAVLLGVDVPPDLAAAVTDDQSLAGRVDVGFDGSVDAVALGTDVAPLDNVAVRKALVYALSRAAYRQAEGGKALGRLATTLLSPGLASYRVFDLWQAPPDGDPAKARQALAAAGHGDGFTLAFDPRGDPAAVGWMRETLARVGVKVHVLGPADKGVTPALTMVRWTPSRPAAAAVLSPLVCDCGRHNVSGYSSNDVDQRIAAARQQTAPDQAEQEWAQVDMRALQDVPLVPLLHRQVIRLHGPAVTNAHVTTAYGGEYDLAALSVG